MILTALAEYYQRLLANPDVESGLARVPSFGFSEEKISYILVISNEGKLVDVQNNLEQVGKKYIPKLLRVPQPEKKSINISPNFLWGNSQYVIGVTNKEIKPPRTLLDYFNSFKKLHLEALYEVEDESIKAFLKFCEYWNPEKAGDFSCITDEMIDTNFVFKLDGKNEFIHESLEAQKIWSKLKLPDEATPLGYCLVSDGNRKLPIARLHDPIKGGYLSKYGGQTGGCSIVSFNKESFTSYGKSQGENAPISESAAYSYTTALNYLLRSKNGQCISIGDTSTVFWAVADNEKCAQTAEFLFGWMINNMPTNTDDSERAQINPILEKIARGCPLAEFAPDISPNTRFYVLGIAPNASRLSIRYWMDTTFGQLAENNKKHWLDLKLNPPAWQSKPPSLWQLLIQTTPKRKDQDGRLRKSDSKDIPPQLAGEFMRAVLTGQQYPLSLLAKLISRIRADGYLNGLRVAMIKAVLNRNLIDQKEIPVGLDKEEIDKAYRLGRLFAVLEMAQSAALGNLNANIRDRYYGGASSTPNSIFPMLLKNYRNHHAGLRKGKKAEWVKDAAKTAGWLEKEISQIMQVFLPSQPFPKTMSLAEQGRFVIGYYHQKFTKQSDAPDDVRQIAESDVSDNQIEENLGE